MEQESLIPHNLLAPLQAIQYDITIVEGMPYANGIIMLLLGQTTNEGNIITQELQMALSNTSMTVDDMTRFMLNLEDNLKGLMASNPAISEQTIDNFRVLYYTFFIEYLKLYSMNDKFYSLNDIKQSLQSHSVNPELIQNFVNTQEFSPKMYAMSVKNPAGITQPQLCPWVFVYNDSGKTRMFMDKEEMLQYDKKYGHKSFLEKAFKKEHWQVTAIGAGILAAVSIAIGVFAKKKHTKNVEAEKSVIAQIEAEAGEEE